MTKLNSEILTGLAYLEQNNWSELAQLLKQPFTKGAFKGRSMEEILSALDYSKVAPESKDIFRVFQLPPEAVKVVILGQDPYHNGTADGLAFSSKAELIPKSLQNIYRAIKLDFGEEYQLNTDKADLSNWFSQGVFLFNTRLTVNLADPMSKDHDFWDEFVKLTLEIILQKTSAVFLLWGNAAKKFIPLIEQVNNTNNLIVSCSHPSPLSVRHGFLTAQCFLKTNQHLEKIGKEPIKW